MSNRSISVHEKPLDSLEELVHVMNDLHCDEITASRCLGSARHTQQWHLHRIKIRQLVPAIILYTESSHKSRGLDFYCGNGHIGPIKVWVGGEEKANIKCNSSAWFMTFADGPGLDRWPRLELSQRVQNQKPNLQRPLQPWEVFLNSFWLEKCMIFYAISIHIFCLWASPGCGFQSKFLVLCTF